jgi:hypothetical protein
MNNSGGCREFVFVAIGGQIALLVFDRRHLSWFSAARPFPRRGLVVGAEVAN